jgi:hypothetical protein
MVESWVLYLIQVCEAFHGRVYTIVELLEFPDIACCLYTNLLVLRFFFLFSLENVAQCNS